MCRRAHERGDLASIPDITTNNFISYFIADVDWTGNHLTKYAWIGAYKCGQRWCWSDGTPWGFSNWAAHKPDHGDRKRNGAIGLNGIANYWRKITNNDHGVVRIVICQYIP